MSNRFYDIENILFVIELHSEQFTFRNCHVAQSMDTPLIRFQCQLWQVGNMKTTYLRFPISKHLDVDNR